MRATIGCILTITGWPLGTMLTTEATALDWTEDDLYVRVVDVGPGLCAVAIIPGGHAMIYDVGHWNGRHCVNAAAELVPETAEIDLLIISHSDADHLGDAARLLEAYAVGQIVHTGDVRTSGSWIDADEAITAAGDGGATVMSLGEEDIEAGTQWEVGPATVTFVAGWHEWTLSNISIEGERLNAISIVARLEFEGRSILFTGDTIGRRRGESNSACKDAELAMVENADSVSLEADVMTAPHHGGDNGSSNCFIRAVDPEYVIFSAGHRHEHPTQNAADRYIANGVEVDHLFRTDRGDHEGGFEWIFGALAGCEDKAGDDDVEIVITSGGDLAVDYRVHSRGC